MVDRVTRRAVLAGSAATLAGCTFGGRRHQRTITGVPIGQQAGACDVTFLRDGVHAVSPETGPEGNVNVWDLRARRIVRSFRVGRRLWSFTLDEERGLFAVISWPESGGSKLGVVFDFATGHEVRRFGGRSLFGVDHVAAAREGILTSWSDRGQPLESQLWSFDTGGKLASYRRPAEALAADGRTVLGGPVIWDLESERPRGELKLRSNVWGHAISADGSRAVSEQRGSGILWNASGELIHTMDDQINTIARAAFSPDDRFLITGRYPETFRGNRRLLVLRDGRTGRLLAELPGHVKFVRGIAFSPDGSSAVSAGLNGELILWAMPRDQS